MSFFPTLRLSVTLLLCAALLAPLSPAQAQNPAYTVLHAFASGEGSNPRAGLVQASDGTLYGATYNGGAGNGTLYSVTAAGAFSVVHQFDYTNGAHPSTAPILSADGTVLYGTTDNGGVGGWGTAFQMPLSDPTQFSLLYQFAPDGNINNPNGAIPNRLTLAPDGTLYSTAWHGGANGGGVIFSLNPATAAYQVLASFSTATGDTPLGFAALLLASDGGLYGTAAYHGKNGFGTAFRLNPTVPNKITVLHAFTGSDGAMPEAGLIAGPTGLLYGAATHGSKHNLGSVFGLNPVKKTLFTVHAFKVSDGSNPVGTLLLASDGNLYGTAQGGGANGQGVIFRVTPAAPYPYTVLYSFSAVDSQKRNTDGAQPLAFLIQGQDGALYGTAYSGGSNGLGVVFRLDAGLSPSAPDVSIRAAITPPAPLLRVETNTTPDGLFGTSW